MRLSAVVRKVLEKERRIRIVILGPDNAGKTSLLEAYMERDITKINPTYGYQIVTAHEEINNQTYTLEILDIGGQNSIRAYWDTYYSGADGVLFVYDTHGTEEYKKIIEKTISHPTLRDAEFICASNKSDGPQNEKKKTILVRRTVKSTESSFDFMNEKDAQEIESFHTQNMQEKAIDIVHTSAKTRKNVQNVFRTLVENILEKRRNGLLH